MFKKIADTVCYAGCIALLALCGRAAYKVHKGENPVDVITVPNLFAVTLTKNAAEEESDYE